MNTYNPCSTQCPCTHGHSDQQAAGTQTGPSVQFSPAGALHMIKQNAHNKDFTDPEYREYVKKVLSFTRPQNGTD